MKTKEQKRQETQEYASEFTHLDMFTWTDEQGRVSTHIYATHGTDSTLFRLTLDRELSADEAPASIFAANVWYALPVSYRFNHR